MMSFNRSSSILCALLSLVHEQKFIGILFLTANDIIKTGALA